MASKKALEKGVLLTSGIALLFSMGAWAQGTSNYPDRTVRLVVPYPPGGGNDTLGRLVAKRLSEELGQAVVVENRAGASGNIGTEYVARAKPDGYTLTLGFVANMAMTPHLYKIGYDPLRDFEPISMVAEGHQVLVVNPGLPAQHVQELVAMAKAKPNSLNYGSGGSGTPLHLVGELFKSVTQTDIQHVPYKGSHPATTAIISGEVQLLFGSVVATLPHVHAGRVRALAVTSPNRIKSAPDVPTLNELGFPGVEASSWYGLYAPAGTPAPIVQRLNAVMKRLAADPDYQAQLEHQGQEALVSTPQELADFTNKEYKRWQDIIRDANIKLD